MAEAVTMELPRHDLVPGHEEGTVRKGVTDFSLDLAFTEAYRLHQDAHVAIREAKCMQVLFPRIFQALRPGDQLAGRIVYGPIGFGLELASGGPGFYCHVDNLRREMATATVDATVRAQLEDAIAFWQTEATIEGKLVSLLPEDIRAATNNRIASGSGRLAGALLDFEKLVRVGLPGLRKDVNAGREEAARGSHDGEIFDGMLMALDLLVGICEHYAGQARALAISTQDAAWKAELHAMADSLHAIAVRKPATLREGIQLIWLYALISGVVDYGRLDMALGELYVADIGLGHLTEAQALRLLQALWQAIGERSISCNGRIIVGGKGRPNASAADRFALAAMEATRTVIGTEPQLSLRFHKDQNPVLMKKALDVLGEGRTFPMLYNDDVNVPALQRAFSVTEADAERYLPCGCGEYALDHTSLGSPNGTLNLLKALEATLSNGKDMLTGEALGLPLGEFRDFATFDALMAAYSRQVTHHAEALAKHHALEYQAERESAAFLFVSMLYNDCMAAGRSVVNGGARTTGGIVQVFGLVNVADSLAAIKKLVYDEKRLTQDELLAVLRADTQGHEEARRWMLDAPKFGNDDDDVDAIARKVSRRAGRAIRTQAARVGLDYFLMVNVDNTRNATLGRVTAASAEGRRAGSPLADGSPPIAAQDREGVTAFLKSLVKLDPQYHAGCTHTMQFSKQMFGAERPELEALLGAYFAAGGAQATIAVVSRGDMEAAMAAPEKYRTLIVRVGGSSARFVDLTRDVQLDLIKRTPD